MKKLGSYLLIAALVWSLALTAAAAEAVSCTVSADSVSAAAGGTVTVPVRITGNPGFTNFAIALDYDRAQLELVSIDVSDGCGSLAAVNTGWVGEDGQTYGYIVCAAAEQITGDDILFTATFRVCESFSGTAVVRPVCRYLRNQTAVFSTFEEITAETKAGAVTSVLLGDVSNDGKISTADALIVYKASFGAYTLTDAQKLAADINGDGKITTADALKIYKAVLGG